ncbi:MAG: trypsin-like peptidase domain-containing protein, partial [Clostridia bacterium]|nr:trypsin-like peptidase domain-containing protein [Clostridia bacterium]
MNNQTGFDPNGTLQIENEQSVIPLPPPEPQYIPQPSYQPAPNTKNKSGKGKSFFKTVCLSLVLIILCSAASAAASYAVVDYRLSKESGSPSTGATVHHYTPSVSVTGDPLNASEIYDLACAQVVGISIDVTSTNIFGQTATRPVSGSGFVLTPDGYIVTNYHVIEYSVVKGYDISVMFYDGTTYIAEIIGYDTENDIAVIKVDAKDLCEVAIGRSSDMVVGEAVYAVGNPLGELAYTMTSGMVSALDRRISTDENTSINMFQFDAAVNAGNSGGPVYNSKGEVIGVVTAKYSSTGVEGLSFAIPIDDVVAITDQLIEHGYVTGRAFLGVMVQNLSPSAMNVHKYPE